MIAYTAEKSYTLIYVAIDNQSDLNAVVKRVEDLTYASKTIGSKYLLYISRGRNPIVETKPDEALLKIREIYSFGTRPDIYSDFDVQMLFREISKNDFAVMGRDLNVRFLTQNVRFHFIISKQFINLNYQQAIIGKLLSSCMMDKVKSQDCDFFTTIYLGKDMSARGVLDKSHPLGTFYPFRYDNKMLTDDK